ncbi:MAG: DoxX family protein [Sulfurovum sp.]|nr:DoxX family protein [Sulfurovum sp.]
MGQFNNLDDKMISFMDRYGMLLLRISIGVIFFWFGILKFFPGLSPAEALSTQTVSLLSFGTIPPEVSIRVLATWEVLIGIGLIFGVYMRFTLFLLFTQMLGTFTPLFLFPELSFTKIPYAFTIEGQYIVKNIVIVSAGLVLGAAMYSREKKKQKV